MLINILLIVMGAANVYFLAGIRRYLKGLSQTNALRKDVIAALKGLKDISLPVVDLDE